MREKADRVLFLNLQEERLKRREANRKNKRNADVSAYLFLDLCCVKTAYINFYYIPINDTTLELSVFWPSDTENRINELRFSESISLSFKMRLTSVICFCGDVT